MDAKTDRDRVRDILQQIETDLNAAPVVGHYELKVVNDFEKDARVVVLTLVLPLPSDFFEAVQ